MIVCPKCKANGSFVTIYETATVNTSWQQDDEGGIDASEGTASMSGDVTGCWANCGNCDHSWTLRGIAQVTDLVEMGRLIDNENYWT